MSRVRFTSEELFQEEVERLQKERMQLLRERNFTEFTKRISRDVAPSYRESQDTDQATRKNDIEWRSSKQMSRNNSGVKEVKIMLEDIMRNGQRHGLDRKTSLGYLRNIQHKLMSQLKMYETSNVRNTPQIEKLRDLKLFIDKLADIDEDPRATSSTTAEKAFRPSRHHANKKSLEKIPEIPHPSIDNTSSNAESGSLEPSDELSSNSPSSNMKQSVQKVDQPNYDFNKKPPVRELTNKKYDNQNQSPQSAAQIIESIESKLIKQIMHLRNQNTRLHRRLDQRGTSSSNTPRRFNDQDDDTIIHQLNKQTHTRQMKQYQSENNSLKNRIRTLEMELLNWKSLRNIGSKNQMRITEQKLYQELQNKDKQIGRLRRQTQKLSQYLEQSKQNVEMLKAEVRNLNSMIGKGNGNDVKNFPNVRHIGDSQRYLIRTTDHSSGRTPTSKERYHQGSQNQSDALNRNYSNFGNKIYERNYDQDQEMGEQRLMARGRHQQGIDKEESSFLKSYDKMGEYRKLLNNLRSIKK